MHSNFLYIVTFDTPHTYIKTFTSNEKPAKIYQDHVDIYNNIKFINNKIKSHFDINVHYFVNPNDELMKTILQQLPMKNNTSNDYKGLASQHVNSFYDYDKDFELLNNTSNNYKGGLMGLADKCVMGFYDYDKDIELLNKLLQNCKNIQNILKEIGVYQKDDKYHSTPQLKHYKPNQVLQDVPSDTTEYTSGKKTTDDSSVSNDDIAYGLPLSFDVSLLHKDKSNITIDISKREMLPSLDEQKEEIKTEIEKLNNEYEIVDEPVNQLFAPKPEPPFPVKETPQHIKDVFGVPLMDANLYGKIEKFTFNTAKEYKNMINDRTQLDSIPVSESVAPIELVGMTESLLYSPNRKRQHIKGDTYYTLPTQTGVENDLDNNVALVQYLSYQDQPYVLMTTNEIIKLKASVNYFPEFHIIYQYLTPDDDEYYGCLAIKINKFLKKNNNTHKLKDEMHQILSSINLFLDMDEYDKFLMTELYHHKTTSIDKILIAIKNFSKQFDKTYEKYDDTEREFILVKDFLKQFGEYLKENNLELDENELNNHETTVCQYLVFHKQVEMGMTDDLQKTLFLKKNMVSVPANDIPVMKCYNGIKIPPRFGDNVRTQSNNRQLRSEPIIDKIPISAVNQSSKLWVEDKANIKLDIPNCAPKPIPVANIEGINTVGQTLRNGFPERKDMIMPEPKIPVSPWIQTTIEPGL